MADIATAERQVQAQQLDAAEATLRAHLAQHPEDADAQFLAGPGVELAGRPEQALPIYQRLLRQQPDNADYLLGEGTALGRSSATRAGLAGACRDTRAGLRRGAAGDPAGTRRADRAHHGDRPVPVTAAATKRRHELEISARQDWLDSGFDNRRSQRLITPRPGRKALLVLRAAA